MLHLQSANFQAIGMDSLLEDPMTVNNDSLVFERVVGSLGASLSFDDYLATSESYEDDVAVPEQRARVSTPGPGAQEDGRI